MTCAYPDFNDLFNTYYNTFSIRSRELTVPDWFDVYLPDNSADASCLTVVSPSVDRGATRWTLNGQWITIGIYRDEGRPTTQSPARGGLSWTRSQKYLTITDTQPHHLAAGDVINLYTVNVGQVLNASVTSVTDSYTFTVPVPNYGATSGALGAYQLAAPTNFYQDYVVFRLLPSFKLVPYSLVQELFSSSAPPQAPAHRTMYNITTNTTVQLPTGKTSVTNYDLPLEGISPDKLPNLDARFGQAYDELGNPLPLQYSPSGQVSLPNIVDQATAPGATYLDQPFTGTSNDRVYVYDFYGSDINASCRGPYHASDIITRDTTVAGSLNNFKYKLNNGQPIYTGKLYDEYGNVALGIQPNNALVVRQAILPLQLDSFFRPVKAPQPRSY